jgi:protein-L-isoaspartate(D-aspartate) O-methyltransferase
MAREIDAALCHIAGGNLAAWSNVDVSSRNVFDDVPDDLDAIVASAGLSGVPVAWLRALVPGGRLLFPLTADGEWPIPGDPARTWTGGAGAMLLVTGAGLGFAAEFLDKVGFYHCQGGRSFGSEEKLRLALREGELSAVKSLHLGTCPDGNAWLSGPGWWLSKEPL